MYGQDQDFTPEVHKHETQETILLSGGFSGENCVSFEWPLIAIFTLVLNNSKHVFTILLPFSKKHYFYIISLIETHN